MCANKLHSIYLDENQSSRSIDFVSMNFESIIHASRTSIYVNMICITFLAKLLSNRLFRNLISYMYNKTAKNPRNWKIKNKNKIVACELFERFSKLHSNYWIWKPWAESIGCQFHAKKKFKIPVQGQNFGLSFDKLGSSPKKKIITT